MDVLNLLKEKTRNKRAVDENFKVLLGLYKLNPLKKSKLYQNFTNKLLFSNYISNNVNKTFELNSTKEKKGEKEISVKIQNILNSIHKEVKINENRTEQIYHLADSEEETFSENTNVLQSVLNTVNQDELFVVNKTSDNIFNYLSDHIESEDSSGIIPEINNEIFLPTATAVPIVVTTVISIQGADKVEETRTGAVMGEKVESKGVFEETDNDVIVIR